MIIQVEGIEGRQFIDSVDDVLVMKPYYTKSDDAISKLEIKSFFIIEAFDRNAVVEKGTARDYKVLKLFKNNSVKYLITNALFYILNNEGKTININGFSK